MKVLIVHAHPEPKSFNGALLRAAVAALRAGGHLLEVSDLYAMAFDPVSDRRNFSSTKDPDSFEPETEETHASAVGGFVPALEREMRKVEACDLMIWQFPLWWCGLPAILKGWVDRVFAMGRAYGGGKSYDTGVFRGKRALLSLTVGGAAVIPAPGGAGGTDSTDGAADDLLDVLRPIHHGILRFVGFDVLAPHVVHGLVHSSDAERKAALEAYARRLVRIDMEKPIDAERC